MRVQHRRGVRLDRHPVPAAQVLEPQRGHDRHHRGAGRLVAADLQPASGWAAPGWRGGRSPSTATAPAARPRAAPRRRWPPAGTSVSVMEAADHDRSGAHNPHPAAGQPPRAGTGRGRRPVLRSADIAVHWTAVRAGPGPRGSARCGPRHTPEHATGAAVDYAEMQAAFLTEPAAGRPEPRVPSGAARGLRDAAEPIATVGFWATPCLRRPGRARLGSS